MRTRGLRWAGVLLAWAVLTPSVGWAQQVGTLGLLFDVPHDENLPPLIVRGQMDTAVNYAPPDPQLASPLYSTRPESGWFFHGEYLLFRQTVPLRNQLVASRGFLDVDGGVTGTVGTFVGSGAAALQTNQVRGPGSYQPGFEAGFGYRFEDGTTVDVSWWHLTKAGYGAVATLLPPLLQLDQPLANTFLFSPVFNFPSDFAGPTNDVAAGTGHAFGIWNAADLMTIEFVQRNEIFDLTVRKPIFETECWRTYGLVGPRFVWFWERFKWLTVDLNINGDAAPPENTAIYTNIVSNRMYGAFCGIGNECYLGHGFSTSLDLEGALFLNIVKERAKYERGDRHVGPERQRKRIDYTTVPEAKASLNLWWYPYEGIQVKLGYDAMAFFNTVAGQTPIDFDYSAVAPQWERVFRFLDGLNIGIAFSF
ncbi:MAG TPA: hypothetical protein VKD72_01540 [Gemmataceae bacterium]|nr:hypothetical protein [Gemmataceae bacterium]